MFASSFTGSVKRDMCFESDELRAALAALGCFGLLWVVWAARGYYGLLWADLGCSGLLWAAVGCSGLHWAALGSFGLIWVTMGVPEVLAAISFTP